MKRKLKWLAIVVAVLLLGFGAALLLWPRDRITAESWQRVRIGMTEDEVVGILGSPATTTYEEADAQYRQLEKELDRAPWEFEGPILEEPAGKFVVGETGKIWNGRRGIIAIDLDQNNHVCRKTFHGGRWINGNIFDRLRDWLGR
jgi:hypothetical protein